MFSCRIPKMRKILQMNSTPFNALNPHNMSTVIDKK